MRLWKDVEPLPAQETDWGRQVREDQEKWDREHPPEVRVERDWWCFFSLTLVEGISTYPARPYVGTAAGADRCAQRMLDRHARRKIRERENRWVVR